MGNTCSQDTTINTDGTPPATNDKKIASTSSYDPTQKDKGNGFKVVKCEPGKYKPADTVIDIQSELEKKKERVSVISMQTGGREKGPFEYIDLCEEGKKGIYDGTFSNDGLRCGEGTMVWEDGSLYSGQWKGDMANGWGYLILPTKDHYFGLWKDDKAHGNGTYVHADGSRYEGNWEKDKQQGEGAEYWTDGSTFKGIYKDSKKNGPGEFKWADGTMYKGNVVDNKFEGNGIYKWQDDRYYDGEWSNNQMHGTGEFQWADGKKYKGQFLHDKKHGEGEFTWPDGRRYKGSWKEGKQCGIGTFFDGSNKQGYKGEWLADGKVKWDNDIAPKNNAKSRR